MRVCRVPGRRYLLTVFVRLIIRRSYEKRIFLRCPMFYSDFILNNMNLSVDPCVDFYEYSCGGWIKNNPVLSSQSHVNQFQLAEEKLHANIKG